MTNARQWVPEENHTTRCRPSSVSRPAARAALPASLLAVLVAFLPVVPAHAEEAPEALAGAAGHPGSNSAGPRTWSATGLCGAIDDDPSDAACA
jgi:hypothetical protein